MITGFSLEAKNTLEDYRLDLLRQRLARGELLLDGDAYRRFRRESGLTRTQVDNAIDWLLFTGEVRVMTTGPCLVVKRTATAGRGEK